MLEGREGPTLDPEVDIHFDAILIGTVENLHSLDGCRNGLATPHQYTINIKGKGVRICDEGLGRCHGGLRRLNT